MGVFNINLRNNALLFRRHSASCCQCQVFTFGCNDHWALGREVDDDGELSFYPLFVDLGCTVIAQVSAGDSHTAALSREGRVYIWGAFRVPTPRLFYPERLTFPRRCQIFFIFTNGLFLKKTSCAARSPPQYAPPHLDF